MLIGTQSGSCRALVPSCTDARCTSCGRLQCQRHSSTKPAVIVLITSACAGPMASMLRVRGQFELPASIAQHSTAGGRQAAAATGPGRNSTYTSIDMSACQQKHTDARSQRLEALQTLPQNMRRLCDVWSARINCCYLRSLACCGVKRTTL